MLSEKPYWKIRYSFENAHSAKPDCQRQKLWEVPWALCRAPEDGPGLVRPQKHSLWPLGTNRLFATRSQPWGMGQSWDRNMEKCRKRPYFRQFSRKTAFTLLYHVFISDVYFYCLQMYCRLSQASIYWWKCYTLSFFLCFSTFCFHKPTHKNPYLFHWQF